MSNQTKRAKRDAHTKAADDATYTIKRETDRAREGATVDMDALLAAAKVLETVGCWIRRNPDAFDGN